MRNNFTNINNYFTYKYKIKEKIEKLSYSDYLIAKRTLPKMLGINTRTFEKYMYTKLSEKYEMPVGQIAILAKFLNCTMEDLLNYAPKQITIKGISKEEKNDLAKSLGLQK
jgi:DNA-binding Xre family transcriptional regulator